MRKIAVFLTLGLAALCFAAGAAAGGGDDHGGGAKAKHGEHHGKQGFGASRFTFRFTKGDTGTCQNVWANDTTKRTYVVKPRHDGSYVLVAVDRGTFTTLAGQSPGACEKTSKHGTTVTAGITGRFNGYIAGVVAGGTLKPNATCAAICDRAAFVAAFFGAGAKFSCDVDQSCAYFFSYHAKADKTSVAHRHWIDAGRARGGVLKAVNRGDIANV
jgi:hypothetical protein